jgi:hypothetical protein
VTQTQAPPSEPETPNGPGRFRRIVRDRRVQIVAVAVVVVLAGAGIAAAVMANSSTKTAARTPAAQPVPIRTLVRPLPQIETLRPLRNPKPSDFAVSLKVVAATCAGSGGGSLTVEPVAVYTGPDISGVAWALSYELQGGRAGSVTRTINGKGTSYAAAPQLVQVSRCSQKLIATPTGLKTS